MEPASFERIKQSSVANDSVKWSRYNVVVAPENGIENWLLYNTASGKLLAFGQSPDAIETHYTPGAPLGPGHEQIHNLGILVDEKADEFGRVRFEWDRIRFGRQQYLTILPTEQCNFRCVYCYEDFVKGTISEEMQEALITWTLQNISEWTGLHVGWFGGEPLISYETIRRLGKQFVALCDEQEIPFTSSMTTNGYNLMLDRAQELRTIGVRRYQITLDGVGEQHDRHRHLIGGQGTYARIMQNLVAIHNSELDVQITIRMNIDRDNGPHLTELLDELARQFANDDRFFFRVFAVGKWGGDNDSQLDVYDAPDALCQTENMVLYGLDKGLMPVVDDLHPHRACYAGMPNSLIIGSDGTIYKCTVAFDNPVNHVGKLLPSGELSIDNDRFSRWVSSDGVSDPGCQQCQVHPICHGATCPLVRIEQGIRPCPPAKADLPGHIRMLYRAKHG
jgi:uncharacterized protein